MSDHSAMTGKDFINRVRMLAKESGEYFGMEKKRGKGSHQTIYYGNRKTIIRNP